MNLSPSAYNPAKKGCRKLPLGYVPKVKIGKALGHVTPKKKVAQFDLSGNLIKIHESIGEASRSTGVREDIIRKVFNGRRMSPTNFVFKGVTDAGSFIEPSTVSRLKPDDVRFIVDNYRTIGNANLREMFGMSESGVRNVAMGRSKCGVLCNKYPKLMEAPSPKRVIRVNKDGRELVFKSIGEAARSVGGKTSTVQRALLPGNETRIVKGYRFRYAL